MDLLILVTLCFIAGFAGGVLYIPLILFAYIAWRVMGGKRR
jgi:hypothetical protein